MTEEELFLWKEVFATTIKFLINHDKWVGIQAEKSASKADRALAVYRSRLEALKKDNIEEDADK